jgi:hypothetical protein
MEADPVWLSARQNVLVVKRKRNRQEHNVMNADSRKKREQTWCLGGVKASVREDKPIVP